MVGHSLTSPSVASGEGFFSPFLSIPKMKIDDLLHLVGIMGTKSLDNFDVFLRNLLDDLFTEGAVFGEIADAPGVNAEVVQRFEDEGVFGVSREEFMEGEV